MTCIGQEGRGGKGDMYWPGREGWQGRRVLARKGGVERVTCIGQERRGGKGDMYWPGREGWKG